MRHYKVNEEDILDIMGYTPVYTILSRIIDDISIVSMNDLNCVAELNENFKCAIADLDEIREAIVAEMNVLLSKFEIASEDTTM